MAGVAAGIEEIRPGSSTKKGVGWTGQAGTWENTARGRLRRGVRGQGRATRRAGRRGLATVVGRLRGPGVF